MAKQVGVVNEMIDPLKAYTTCPPFEDWKVEADADYTFFCDNETIYGVEFNNFPYEKFED